MYTIQMLARFVLSVDMSNVQMAYIKKDSHLLSNLRNAEAALKTMEGIGPGHAELRAKIASHALKLTSTGGDEFSTALRNPVVPSCAKKTHMLLHVPPGTRETWRMCHLDHMKATRELGPCSQGETTPWPRRICAFIACSCR